MDPRIANANHATRRNGRTQTAIDYRRWHNRHGTEHSAKAARAKSRQTHSTGVVVDSLQLPRPAFADEHERSLNYQKEHPNPEPSRSGAQQAQEYGGTKWNLRGFSRTGRRVTH
jgi:hypothetical protein